MGKVCLEGPRTFQDPVSRGAHCCAQYKWRSKWVFLPRTPLSPRSMAPGTQASAERPRRVGSLPDLGLASLASGGHAALLSAPVLRQSH